MIGAGIGWLTFVLNVVRFLVHHHGGVNMTTLTATAARKGFFELLKKTNDQHEIYHIHHRSGDAVLMSEEEYDSLNETLELLSSPGFREGFEKARQEEIAGDTVSFKDVFGEDQ